MERVLLGLKKFVIACFLFTIGITGFFPLVLARFWSGLGGFNCKNLAAGLVTLLVFSSTLACCLAILSSWVG